MNVKSRSRTILVAAFLAIAVVAIPSLLTGSESVAQEPQDVGRQELTEKEVADFLREWKKKREDCGETGGAQYFEALGPMIRQVVRWDEKARPLIKEILLSGPGDLARDGEFLIFMFEHPNLPEGTIIEEGWFRGSWGRPRLVPWLGQLAEDIADKNPNSAIELAVKHHSQPGRVLYSVYVHNPLDREDVLDVLPTVMASDDARVREMVSKSLKQGDDGHHDVAWERTAALDAARRLNDPSYVPHLVPLLDDTRRTLTRGLGRFFVTKMSAEQLERLEELDSKGELDRTKFEPQIRHHAAYLIQKLTGRDYGFESVHESWDDMPDITARIKEDLAAE
jgi:hypothetical protein